MSRKAPLILILIVIVGLLVGIGAFVFGRGDSTQDVQTTMKPATSQAPATPGAGLRRNQ